MCGTIPSLLKGSRFGESLQLWSHHTWGGVLGKAVSPPVESFSMLLFGLLLWRGCSSSSQVLFRGKLFVAVDLLCPWEEVFYCVQGLPLLQSWTALLALSLDSSPTFLHSHLHLGSL